MTLGFSVSAFAQDADPAMGGDADAEMQNVSGPFDLERCVKRALALNPSMVAIRAQLQGSQFGTRSQFGNFLPSLGGTYGYTNSGRKSTTSGKKDEWAASINVSQPVFQGSTCLLHGRRPS